MSYLIALNKTEIKKDSININLFKEIIDSEDNYYVYIDIEKLYNSTTQNNWLDNYGKYIDYEKSKDTIEKLHSITDSTIIKAIDNLISQNKYDCKTYKELKDHYNFTFDDKTYKQNNYHILSFDTNGKLNKANKGTYDNTKYCFSSPFLATIVDKNGIVDDNKFYFVLFKNTLGNDALGIKIDVNSGKYYDFSQTPPPTVNYDKGNPLSYGNSKGNVFHVNEEILFEFNGKLLVKDKIEKTLKEKQLGKPGNNGVN